MPSSTPFPGHSGPLRPTPGDDESLIGTTAADDAPLWGDGHRPVRPSMPRLLAPVLDRAAEVADRMGTSVPVLVGGALLVVVVAAGVVVVMGDDGPAPELTIPYAAAPAASSPEPGGDADAAPAGGPDGTVGPSVPSDPELDGGEVLVHAAGAVTHPGLYVLDSEARVGDLLTAAGGPRPDADLDRVNLAAPLADGSRVYVPAIGQESPPSVVAGDERPGGGGAPAPGAPDPGRLIDLNQADAAELETLPGVGPATAAAIISHRETNGPFQRVEDLLSVRGIGDAKLAAIADLVHT